ncbi:conserved hypothetical protein [Arthrobacter sp. Hiyo8]|nr:conserved hypothetical protein [Arthrobacter sp. Hiyo8]
MAEGGDNAPYQHGRVAVRDGGEEVAGDEQDEEPDEHRLAGQAGDGRRHKKGADNNAERIAGDEPPCGRFADSEVSGNLGQEAHDDKLGQANAESAQGKDDQPCGHVVAPLWGWIPVRVEVRRREP